MNLTIKRAELLRRQVLGCERCHLHLFCSSPTPPEIPVSHVPPELLIVAEAPGSQEEKQRVPLVGPAGQLIFRWLKLELGLRRSQVWATNSVLCRPTTANKGRMNRQPSRQEMELCADWLGQVIDLYVRAGGEWILLLGGTALSAMLPFGAKITQWAGRPFVLKTHQGLVSVMPTFHPAAALRDPSHSPAIRRHLNYLMALRKDRANWPDACTCGKSVAVYDGMGVAWCEGHRGFRRESTWVPQVKARQQKMVV